MNITIRRIATPTEMSNEHFYLLNSLDSRCFKGEELYPKIGSYWWVAYDSEEPIGFAGMTVYNYIEKPASFLSRVGVLPKARGYGLQRRFIRTRERMSKKLGFNRIITYSSYENIISANNLIKCGYYLYTPDSEWGVKNGLYFEKVIK